MADDIDAFRDRARSWLRDNATEHGWHRDPDRDPDREDPDERIARARTCQALLFEAGFTGITWPVEYGGQGLTNRHQIAFNQEAGAYELPVAPFIIGLGMCGPTILAVGTDEQKRRYLPRLLSGADVWCQMFSELGAGSDVASLATRAEATGGGWVLNGQKVWTSVASHAQYGMCLARTGLARHAGLTMFVVDMKAPGLTVRPLRQMNGVARFNEVFLEGVEVDADAVLGDVGGGWRAAVATLMNERVSIGTGSPNTQGHDFPVLLGMARSAGATTDPRVRQDLAWCWTVERLLRLLGQRITDAILAGRQPGPEGSLSKLLGTALAKRTTELALHLAGPAGGAWDAADAAASRRVSTFLASPALSIAGGTDEILRNIVAERVLGLPKEPEARAPAERDSRGG